MFVEKVILIDDMVDTAGTLCNSAQALIDKGGATEVIACATHGVLSGPAIERLQNSCIKELILLDTIPLPPKRQFLKLHCFRWLRCLQKQSSVFMRINLYLQCIHFN